MKEILSYFMTFVFWGTWGMLQGSVEIFLENGIFLTHQNGPRKAVFLGMYIYLYIYMATLNLYIPLKKKQ